MQTKNCLKCKKIFTKTLSRSRKSWEMAKFCSRKCGLIGKKASEETKKKMSLSRIGKKWPPEMYAKRSGAKNPAWKGGVTPIHYKIRNSVEYALWRTAVFTRDKFTCVWCGQRGGRLNADHIKPFALFPELRLAIDNGRTLCEPCHRKTDTYCRKLPKL